MGGLDGFLAGFPLLGDSAGSPVTALRISKAVTFTSDDFFLLIVLTLPAREGFL
jgi:hypothetical protein